MNNSTVLVLFFLFALAALSMLTTFQLTTKACELMRAGTAVGAVGHTLAALYMAARLLGEHVDTAENLTTLAMILISVGAIAQALSYVLERRYHQGDLRDTSH